MNNSVFKGAGVAIVTPFDKDGNIDFEEFKHLIQFQIAGETDAIIVCGTTGESSTLTTEEHLTAIDFVVKEVNHTIPVIAGTGSNDTKFAIWLSKEAEKLGADAVLLVTPYYNKTTQEGLFQHFAHIADGISIPAILYNIPSRTGVNIDIATYQKLSYVPNIVAVKEASGNISYVAKLIAEYGDRFDVYSGNDDMIVPIMSLGGIGVISVLSNIMPTLTHMITAYCLENDFLTAQRLQIRYLDLINALFCEVNPIPVKKALQLMGFNVGDPRLPLYPISDEHEMVLKEAMWKHNLIG